MKKKYRIKGEDEVKAKLAQHGVRLFATPEEAFQAAVEEAEAAGVSPGAVMAMSPGASVTGAAEGMHNDPVGDEVDEPAAYEPSEGVSGDSDEDDDDEPDDDASEEVTDETDDSSESDEDDEKDDFEGFTRDQLLDAAKEAGLHGYHSWNKQKLIDALEGND